MNTKYLIADNWKIFIRTNGNLAGLLGVFFLSLSIITSHYLHIITLHNRTGVILNDPILNFFGPYDFNISIFAFTYIPIVVAILYVLPRPQLFMNGLLCYALLLGMRMITMELTPLDPPPTMISLKDPLLDWILQTPKHLMVTKDLFFSGHTSTLFLFFYLIDHRILRPLFFISAILVGTLITLQHVHYSVDTICAPVFAWGAYGLGTKLYIKFNQDLKGGPHVGQ